MKMRSNRTSQSPPVGMQTGSAPLEDSLAVSYKTKHTVTIGSSNCALGYLPKGVENLGAQKTLHTDVYSSFIPNCQNLQTPKMLFRRS